MKILVTGSSGLIGSALVTRLNGEGHAVVRLIRGEVSDSADVRVWDPSRNSLKSSVLEGFDAVVHLAGENLASGRWTESRKVALRESRLGSTRLLGCALAELRNPPRVLLSASAIGIYGSRDDEILTESSDAGTGFLAELGSAWEAAAVPAIEAGIRVVYPRFGIVLSALGGALQKMLPAFRLGFGGKLGNGRQYWSWITLDDAVSALCHLLSRKDLSGPVNLVAPLPVTNMEFTRTLGRVLSRPTIFPVPAFLLRILLGQMADEALLASTRVAPGVLTSSGFSFQHAKLEGALTALLTLARA